MGKQRLSGLQSVVNLSQCVWWQMVLHSWRRSQSCRVTSGGGQVKLTWWLQNMKALNCIISGSLCLFCSSSECCHQDLSIPALPVHRRLVSVPGNPMNYDHHGGRKGAPGQGTQTQRAAEEMFIIGFICRPLQVRRVTEQNKKAQIKTLIIDKCQGDKEKACVIKCSHSPQSNARCKMQKTYLEPVNDWTGLKTCSFIQCYRDHCSHMKQVWHK